MSENLEDHYVALIQKNEGIIHKVISLYINNPEDKKDLFQEILLQAWKSFEKFEGRSSFKTWLYRIALNTVFTYKRTEKKSAELVETALEATEKTTENDDHELLYQLILQLDEVDRTLMTLHLDGYKNKEIAKIMGMTANHVNVKIHRLKNQITEAFKKATNGYI